MSSADSVRNEQASLWWVRLREDDVTPEEITEWLDWCQRDPANLKSFEEIEALGGSMVSLDASARSQLVQDLLEPDTQESKSSRRRVPRRPLAIAASVLLVVGLVGAFYTQSWLPGHRANVAAQHSAFQTRKAEIRDVKLVDGSKIAIGAETSLSVDYSPMTRNLKLGNGQAYFQVEHNPKRPFIVHAGQLQVTAVGTAFDIRRTGDQVEVIVTRGVVDVENDTGRVAPETRNPLALPANDVIRVAAGQSVVANGESRNFIVRPADTKAAVSWLNGNMSFVDENLSLVIANLNRYAHAEVVIADPRLRHLRFTGSVVQGEESEWLSAIQKVFPITVQHADDGRILLYHRGELQAREARS